MTDLLLERGDGQYLFQSRQSLTWATAIALVALITFFGAAGSNAFIYFQF